MTLSSESRLGGIPFSFFLYFSVLLIFCFSLPLSTHSQYNTWQQLDPNAGVPFLRNQFGMISDPGNEDSIFMFFGFDEFANSIYNETWIYNRNENWWSQIQLNCTTSSSCPSPRIGYSLMSFGGGEDLFDAKHRRSPSSSAPSSSSPSSSRHSIRIDSSLPSPSPPSQGSILMFGGQRVVESYPSDYLWSFDIQTSTWSLLSTGIKNNASFPSVRAFQSGVQFDNRFVIFGGEWAGTENLNDLWSFDPRTLRWSPIGNQDSTWPPPTSRHSAIIWEDSMFVFGGCVEPAYSTYSCGVNNNLWIFNFTSSEWNRLVSNGTNDPNWPAGRQSHVGVLAGEKMVIYGGIDEGGNILSDGWEFDFSNVTWKVVPPQSLPAEGRYAQASVAVGGDCILLFGGSGTCDKTPIMSVFYGWNVTTDIFYPILSPMLQQSQEPYVTTSTDGSALYFTTVYASFARYFVAPDQAYWQALSPVPVVPSEPICGLVTLNASTLALFQLNPAQLNIYYYDTTTNVWTTETAKDITDCRSVIRVQDNTVFVLQSTALLSLQTDTTPPVVTILVAPPVSLSNGDAAVVVSDGVYVFGVSPTSYLLYNITQNNWTQPSLLSTSAGAPINRNHPSVVSIGVKILVFGGEIGGSELFGDLWEFDTVVGNWSQMITGGVGNSTPIARYWSAGAAVGTTMYLFGGFNGYIYLTDFWMIALACNAGTSCSQNFFEGSSCLPCAYGNYSMNPGSSECTSCPFGLTTLETGATSNSQCTNCTKNYCHQGSCTPIQAVGATCQCDFGFLPFDRCFFPWLWLVGVVAVSLVVWGIVRFRRRLAVQKGTIRQQEEELAQLYDVWKIDPTELTWVSRLSSGGFGDVWRCEWRENVVAVKKLHQHWVESDPKAIEEFENEVKVLRSIRHPRIVLFFGAGQLEDGTPFLVTEFVPKGSLSSLLREEETPFAWKQKIGFLLDAANGMQFLHSGTPPKIHRDIKPQNFLVTSNLRIKIADFGTAKLISTQTKVQGASHRLLNIIEPPTTEERHRPSLPDSLRRRVSGPASTTQIGTLPYMAPELHAKTRVTYSKEVDVYSFGLTMWVVGNDTGEDPFMDIEEFEIVQKVAAGERPTFSIRWPQDWVSLMRRCWDTDPTQRPTFDEIAAELHAMHLDM